MTMECFEIKWRGMFSLDDARNQPEARGKGIYVVYRGKTLHYIGKSTELGRRFNEHIASWSRILSERQLKQCTICIGTIYTYDGNIPSPNISANQLQIVETYLINVLKPIGNNVLTKKGYRITPIIIVHTGKRGKLKKVMSHSSNLLKLLEENLTKKTKISYDY